MNQRTNITHCHPAAKRRAAPPKPHPIARRVAILAAAAILRLVNLSSPAQATGDLVQNGGFETGDFTGWTLTGDPADTFVSVALPRTGAYGVLFGALDGADQISQNLATTPGESYVVSFWFSSGDNEGGIPNGFKVQWANTTLVELRDLVHPAWTNMQFIVTATQTSTPLIFGGWNEKDYILLDDVSVAPPAPAFIQVKHENASVSLVWTAIPGRSYQVQYSTTLPSTAWQDLASPVVATGPTASLSDNLSVLQNRFYRVLLLP